MNPDDRTLRDRKSLRDWVAGDHETRPTRAELRDWALTVLLLLWNAEQALKREKEATAGLRRTLQRRAGGQRKSEPELEGAPLVCGRATGDEPSWLEVLQRAVDRPDQVHTISSEHARQVLETLKKLDAGASVG